MYLSTATQATLMAVQGERLPLKCPCEELATPPIQPIVFAKHLLCARPHAGIRGG